MRVKIRMFGVLKKISGRDSILLSLERELKLKEIIEKVSEEINALKDILLDPELRDPRPNVIILVNGKDASLLDGLETRIKDGDEITLIPVVHGG